MDIVTSDAYLRSIYDDLDISSMLGMFEGAECYIVHMQGWMNDGFVPFLERAIAGCPSGPVTAIEVGSWKGASTHEIAQRLKNRTDSKIIAVDTWLGAFEHIISKEYNTMLNRVHGYPTIYREFISNMKAYGYSKLVSPLPLPSNQAYDVLLHQGITADIVYIDAAHDEIPVFSDISLYFELLKIGGFMIGDDFQIEGVSLAVKRFSTLKKIAYEVQGNVWFMIKTF